MKKVLCLSTVLLCLSAGLFGCGDKKEAKSKNDETTTAVTTSADTTAEKKSEGDADVSAYLGKWECKEVLSDGQKTDNILGMDAFALFQIELLDGGDANFFSFMEFKEGYEFTKLKWELEDDGNVKIDSELFSDLENGASIKLEDGRLVMDLSDEYSEFIAYLEKVDEFTEIPEDEEMSIDFSAGGDTEFESDGSNPEADTTDAE